MTTLAALLAFTAPLQSAPWEDLFDGKSLDNWHRLGGQANYRIEDGAIVGSTVPNTPNTFLCTYRTFADFEMEFDFKVHPELNSGIQIRSHSVPGYQNGRVHGYQCEIDPSERAYTGGVYDESRRGWLKDLADNPEGRKAFRQNEWNHYRIRAVGDHIQTWVNGILTADVHDKVDRNGFIGLQVHGVGGRTDTMEVAWKNIRVRDFGNPDLRPPAGGKWLLNQAEDTKKWTRRGAPGQDIGWKWDYGFLEVVPGTGDVMTRETFNDCEAYIEFMVDDNGQSGQANGNSGFYLQGRYEVQILNSAGQEPQNNIAGSVYSVKAPDYNMALPAYQWQSYYVKFRAPRWKDGKKIENPRISVWHNGTLVQDNVEIPNGTTAGGPEEEGPGPFLLQDHGNIIRFRRAWVKPL